MDPSGSTGAPRVTPVESSIAQIAKRILGLFAVRESRSRAYFFFAGRFAGTLFTTSGALASSFARRALSSFCSFSRRSI